MNLQPLYDVKERLESAAIAGTGLLSEDFRLKRAAEAMSPLAEASPVFAKIKAGLEKLLSAPAEERTSVLLDVLALVDAVAYTQGVTGVSGALKPLPAVGGGTYCHVSYGQLHPLLDALTSTGGGRMNIIEDVWKAHPEYFADYRVLPALIAGLGDSYNELADMVANMLQSMGESVIPLLKQGFDPAGKREMVRRVQVIESLSGSKENDFYLSQIPEAKKDVKDALIYALRHDDSNVERLLELCQTERGNAKKMAYWALAHLDAPAAWEYWNKQSAKKPQQVIEYMAGSTSRQAGELVNRSMLEQLTAYKPDSPLASISKEEASYITALVNALPGKPGDTVAESFRKAASLENALDWPIEDQTNKRSFVIPIMLLSIPSQQFSKAIPYILRRALLIRPDDVLNSLAMELYETYGGDYLIPAVTAQLLTKSSCECYEWAETHVTKRGLFQKKANKETIHQLLNALSGLAWDQEKGIYQYTESYVHPAINRIVNIHRPIYQDLDARWLDLLTGNGKDCDRALIHLIAHMPRTEAVAEKAGKYLYRCAIEERAWNSYCFNILIELGWKDWKGFLRKRAEKAGELNYYGLRTVIGRIPLSNAEKAEELKELDKLAWAHKLKIANGFWPSQEIQQWINELSNGKE